MADIHEKIRICIKFCFKLGWTQDETCSAIRHAFGDKAPHSDQCSEIYRKFEKNNKIEKFIPEDPCRTIDICDKFTDDLNIAPKSPVSKLLTPEQKQDRLDVCHHLRVCANEDPTYTSRVITGGSTWVNLPDSETMQQRRRSQLKSTLIVFFDIEGIVHQEFVPPNQAVNADFYCDVLKRLKEAVCNKRRYKCNWLLHHDNTPTHTAKKTLNFLRDNNISVVPHPPKSPDLAPCDFFLFDKIKKELKKYPKTRDKVETIWQEVLCSLQPEDFQEAFEEWQKRWDQCIKSKGDYFK